MEGEKVFYLTQVKFNCVRTFVSFGSFCDFNSDTFIPFNPLNLSNLMKVEIEYIIEVIQLKQELSWFVLQCQDFHYSYI